MYLNIFILQFSSIASVVNLMAICENKYLLSVISKCQQMSTHRVQAFAGILIVVHRAISHQLQKSKFGVNNLTTPPQPYTLNECFPTKYHFFLKPGNPFKIINIDYFVFVLKVRESIETTNKKWYLLAKVS